MTEIINLQTREKRLDERAKQEFKIEKIREVSRTGICAILETLDSAPTLTLDQARDLSSLAQSISELFDIAVIEISKDISDQ